MSERLVIAYGLMLLLALAVSATIWRTRTNSPARMARKHSKAYWAEEKAWQDRIANNTLRQQDEDFGR